MQDFSPLYDRVGSNRVGPARPTDSRYVRCTSESFRICALQRFDEECHGTKSLRDSGGCGVGLSAIPREEIVGSGRGALS